MTDPTPIQALQDEGPSAPSRSQSQDIWLQFRQHKGAMAGAFVLIMITLAVLVGPYIWTLDPTNINIRARDIRPMYTSLWDEWAKTSWAHPLGTDNLGRDLLAQLLSGGRASMAVGWAAMVLTLLIGTTVGVLAGYFKRLDGPLMRLTDLFLSLPILPIVLVAVTLFRGQFRVSKAEPFAALGIDWQITIGPVGEMFVLIVAIIGITSWMPTARIVRGDILALKEREFILAARSIGTSSRKIITRHLLPNVLSPIMVSATLGLATAIITESALSFLGVGFPSDFPTWGKMLADAVSRMEQFPERVLLPGLAISLTVLSVNYLGDGLRDALDPRQRGR
ncbi:MAG: ABC transporter permease [Pseudoprimorskyibacter sp.]|nr:ABC transporter permease [Pseudoprimorskyibacter sp.]